jgi:hypothetical protein
MLKKVAKQKPKTKPDEPAAKTVIDITPHPLLRNIEDKNLRELIHIADEFLNFRNLAKKQTNAQIAEMVLLRVRIAPSAPPGDRELRLQTPLGLTNPICFQVGALREVKEREPNDPGGFIDIPKAHPLSVPVVFNGQIMPGDVDRLGIRARRGQRLVIRAHARRLIPFLADAVPGWFQATIALYDSAGNEVAFADDHTFDPDPVLSYVIPKDGVYEIEIRDAIYRGREDFVYRVEVGELPFITQVFPLGGSAATTTVAKVDGWNLPKHKLELDTFGGVRSVLTTSMQRGKLRSNDVLYMIDTLSERTEREPNDTPRDVKIISLPCIMNGRIDRPGDIDSFSFKGRAGEEFVAEVQARRLRSPLDSLLYLIGPAGKVVAWNDDNVQKVGHLHRDMGVLTHHADSYLRATLPANGVYHIRIADAQSRGGKSFGYRLRIGPPRPDFTLQVTPSSLTVGTGGTVPITVHVLRKDGFDGAVDLALAAKPAGMVLAGARIPPGCSSVTMTLSVPRSAPEKPISLRIIGRARIGDTIVTRRAQPSENVMQAFLWRHLMPSRELVLLVKKTKWAPPPVRRNGSDVLRIRSGGEVEVRYNVKLRKDRKFDLALLHAPDGVTIRDVRSVSGGVMFTLHADGEKVKPGAAGNLIIEAFVELPVRAKKDGDKKKAKKPRRISAGVWPAIPFVVGNQR